MRLKFKNLTCLILALVFLLSMVTPVLANDCYSTVKLTQHPFSVSSDNPVYVTVGTEYSLVFSGNLNASATDVSVLYLNNSELTESDASISVSGNTLKVVFSEPSLVSGVDYKLDINGLKDSNGKYISPLTLYMKAAGNVAVEWNNYIKKGDSKIRFNGAVDGKIGIEAKLTNNTGSALSVELVCEKEKVGEQTVTDVKSATLSSGEEKTLVCELDVASDEEVYAQLRKANGEVLYERYCVTETTTPTSYYLVDDRFGHTITDIRGVPYLSGWRVNRGTKTNKVEYTAFGGLTLNDTSTGNSVNMEKSFLRQSDGVLTFETGFSLNDAVGKFEISLDGYRNDERVSAVKIGTTQSAVTVFDGVNRIDADKLAVGSEYRFKITANLDEKKFTVYMNGKRILKDAEFYQNPDFLNYIKITTPGTGVVSANIDYVKLYKNFGVNEAFLCSGETLDEWCESMTNVSLSTRYGVMDADSSCVALGQGASVGSISKNLDYVPNNPELSFAVKLNEESTLNVKAFDKNSVLTISNKNLSAGTLSYSLQTGVWYDIKLSKTGNSAEVCVNGISLGTVNVGSTQGNIVSFSGSNSVLLDDITVRERPNTINLSVNKPADDGVDIHMMNYPMWNEGSHYGWDRISKYPDRSPLIGFYDDCNEEAMNLQIKWLAEHCVDTVIFPVARFSGNVNSSVKNTQRGDAIKAYKNAELKDEIKYAVMWSAVSESTFGGSNDFRENIVPYLTEQYFRDPQYAKVDNKPILYIYDTDTLISIFGSASAFKTEFDYLDAEAKKLGFDGVYVICNRGSQSLSGLGIEGIFSYAVLTNGGVSTTQNQENNVLKAYSQLYGTDYIPCAFMGFDSLPWRGNSEGKGTTLTPNAFKNRLSHIKSNMMSDASSRKILYLGTWNEYGEGHYFMPTSLYGFSYLDAVREVFGGDAAEHSHYIPDVTEQRRYGTMYTGLGTPSRRYEKQKEEYSEKNLSVVKGWYFDNDSDADDWSVKYATKRVEDNQMVLTSTSATDEPELTVDVSSLGINAEDVKYIRVTLGAELDKINGSVFTMHFTTTQKPTMYSNTSFKESLCSDKLRTILIDTSENATWTGTLKELKIWPVYVVPSKCTIGTKYQIEAIELLK